MNYIIENYDFYEKLQNSFVSFDFNYIIENENKIDILFLINEISTLLEIRPKSFDFILKICEYFIQNNKFELTFKDLLIKKMLINHPKLIYFLFLREIYDLNLILNQLTKIRKVSSSIYFFQYISNFKEFIKDFYDYENWFNFFDDYFLNNNELILINSLKYGYPKDSIEYILKFDLIEELKKFSTELPKLMNISLLEYFDKKESISILSFCLFYNSKKCFFYLLEKNNYEIPTDLLYYSIIGGDIDIIKFLEKKNINLNEFIYECSKYRHYNLFNYLLLKYSNIKINPSILFLENNLISTKNIILKGSDINSQNDEIKNFILFLVLLVYIKVVN